MGTTTPNLGLYKPAFEEAGWDDEVNANFDELDERLHLPLGIQYVDRRGDNANDGLTPGTAVEDVVTAYDNLDSTGGGEIRVISSTTGGDIPFWDIANTDRGLWIIGPNDPSYASPPTGFRQQKPLRVVGWGAREFYADATGISYPQTYIAGGSGTDTNKPAIWITGTNAPIQVTGIRCVNLAQPVKLGVAASDVNSNVNTAGVRLEGCYFGTQPSNVTSRAAIEVGYLFWLWIDHCTLACTPYSQSVTAAALDTGTVYSFTVTATSHLALGDTVLLTGSSVGGYNGSWVVTAITDATHFKADIGTNPAAFSGTATVRLLMGATRSAIHFRGEIGDEDSGLVFVQDTTFAGAGVRYEVGGSFAWGNVVMSNVTMEGDFTNEQPAFHLISKATGRLSDTGGGYIRLENVAAADGLWTAGVIRTADAIYSDRMVTVIGSAEVVGPHTNIASDLATMDEDISGFPKGRERRVHGVTSHQSGGVGAARWANLAPQSTAGWGSAAGSATVTTGITDPYGGTNAATLSGSGTRERKVYNASRTVNVGDWFVAGCWVRGTDLTGPPVAIGLVETDYRFELNNSNEYALPLTRLEDNDWRWLAFAAKVSVIGTNPVDTYLKFSIESSLPASFAYPVLNHIPVADGFSDADVREYRDRLVPYSDDLSAGEVGPPKGLVTNVGTLKVGDGNGITKILTGSTTYDPANMATDGSGTGTTLTVAGAAVGDPCFAGLTTLTTQAVLITAHVTAANTVRVDLLNKTGGALDLASGTLKVTVFQNA